MNITGGAAMRWLIKALTKAKQIDPTDVFTQLNTDDLIQLLKEFL